MKRILVLSLILLSTQIHAEVGQHNFVIKAGGGLSASKSIALDSVTTDINGQPTGIDPDSLETKTLGGGFNIDLGYQFFSTSTTVVHGIDALIGFGMSFNKITKSLGLDTLPPGAYVQARETYGSLSATYSVGHQFSNAKLMVDILGLNLTFGNMKLLSYYEDTKIATQKAGCYFGIGMNLPLGLQYIMNNGFLAGFRHSITFLLPTLFQDGINFLAEKDANGKTRRTADYIDYKLNFFLGYMFGK